MRTVEEIKKEYEATKVDDELLFSTLKEAVFVKLNEVKTAWRCVCQSH